MIDLLIILDRSGSMNTRKSDHEGGLRTFIDDQKSLEGDVRVTLTKFDSIDPCEVVFRRVPIDQIDTSRIDLLPRGGTPLHDAIGRSVRLLRDDQAKEFSEKTVAMIITDGYENSSTEFTKSQVRGLLTNLETNAGWTILYLGADIDAFQEASSYGLTGQTTAGFSHVTTGSVGAAYSTVSNNLAAARTSGNYIGTMTFTTNEREAILTGNTVKFDAGATKLESVVIPTETEKK